MEGICVPARCEGSSEERELRHLAPPKNSEMRKTEDNFRTDPSSSPCVTAPEKLHPGESKFQVLLT